MPGRPGRKRIREGFLEEVVFDLVSKGKNLSMQRKELEVQRSLRVCLFVCLRFYLFIYLTEEEREDNQGELQREREMQTPR